VKRIGATGEGFVEWSVDPQPLQIRGQTTQVQDERGTDRTKSQRAFLADQQMRIGGMRTSVALVIEPLDQHPVSQLIERARAAGDGEPSVAEVDIIEVQRSDLAGAGGVHGRQRHAQPSLWSTRGLDGCSNVRIGQSLPDRQSALPDPEPAGRGYGRPRRLV
jgi:hypothetical protein